MDPLPLTDQDKAIAQLLLKGADNQEIGRSLHLSQQDVQGRLDRIYAQLRVISRTQAALELLRRAPIEWV